jgi:putative ABC transport system ATP-binding protein
MELEPIARVDNVRKVHRERREPVNALDGLSLTVAQGEFLAVRGPSGSGKTTLLLTIGGMLRPTSGEVTVLGRNIYALGAGERATFRARTIGFVFQMFHLVPYLSALENVMLAGRGGTDRETRARAAELLASLGLGARMLHTPAELSAGERQRTAVARALFHRPRLLLADEPTGNLDPESAREVLERLREFHRSGGSVILVTHGSVAEGYADRSVRIEAGRVVV